MFGFPIFLSIFFPHRLRQDRYVVESSHRRVFQGPHQVRKYHWKRDKSFIIFYTNTNFCFVAGIPLNCLIEWSIQLLCQIIYSKWRIHWKFSFRDFFYLFNETRVWSIFFLFVHIRKFESLRKEPRPFFKFDVEMYFKKVSRKFAFIEFSWVSRFFFLNSIFL